MDFFQIWIGFLQATQAVKIQFKLGKIPVYQTRNFKLENVKNQVQIDRGLGEIQFNMYIEVFFVSITLSSNNTVGVVKYLWNDRFVTK